MINPKKKERVPWWAYALSIPVWILAIPLLVIFMLSCLFEVGPIRMWRVIVEGIKEGLE